MATISSYLEVLSPYGIGLGARTVYTVESDLAAFYLDGKPINSIVTVKESAAGGFAVMVDACTCEFFQDLDAALLVAGKLAENKAAARRARGGVNSN